MQRFHLFRVTILIAFSCLAFLHFAVPEARGQKLVGFQAEDGSTLYADLRLPEKITSVPVPGLVLLTEPEWHDRAIYETGVAPLAPVLVKNGIAVLVLDPRGHGANQGSKHFRFLSPEETDKLQLDIRAGVQFLASQKGVDPERIGVGATGIGANFAALEASKNAVIRALVCISGGSGGLSRQALDVIQKRKDIPVLSLAGKNNKVGVLNMAQVYNRSENRNSDLIVGMGYGGQLFATTPGTTEKVAQWLNYNLKGLGKSTKVSFRSTDGWTLSGRLRIPDGASESSKVPVVVFAHGAKHDQSTYYYLEQEVIKRGLATLVFDWRAKNRDINHEEGRGNYGVDAPDEVLTKVYLDVKAAIEFSATQKSIDANRIGLVGATGGVDGIAGAAIGDARVKAMVFITPSHLWAGPNPRTEVLAGFKQHIATHDVPLLVIASAEDYSETPRSATEVYEMSKSKHSQLIMYEDAGGGSEVLKTKPDLQPMIVRWLTDRLAPEKKLGEVAFR